MGLVRGGEGSWGRGWPLWRLHCVISEGRGRHGKDALKGKPRAKGIEEGSEERNGIKIDRDLVDREG